MNKFKKIGLSALAGSLVAFSANAGDLSVSGSASLSLTDAGTQAPTGNGWSMGDTLSFSGGGEMDNGMTVSFSYNLDGGIEKTTVCQWLVTLEHLRSMAAAVDLR